MDYTHRLPGFQIVFSAEISIHVAECGSVSDGPSEIDYLDSKAVRMKEIKTYGTWLSELPLPLLNLRHMSKSRI